MSYEVAYAISSWVPKDRNHLALTKNDTIKLIRQTESGWTLGEVNGNKGWFPSAYCKNGTPPAAEDDLSALLTTLDASATGSGSSGGASGDSDEISFQRAELKKAQEEKMRLAFELNTLQNESEESRRLAAELDFLKKKNAKLSEFVQVAKPRLIQLNELERRVAALRHEKTELDVKTDGFRERTEVVITTMREKFENELRGARERLAVERRKYDDSYQELEKERLEMRTMIESLQEELLEKEELQSQFEKLERQMKRLQSQEREAAAESEAQKAGRSEEAAAKKAPVKKSEMNIKVRVKFDWEAKKKNQLSLKKDEWINVTEMNMKGWFYGKKGEQEGWFPSNFIVPPKVNKKGDDGKKPESKLPKLEISDVSPPREKRVEDAKPEEPTPVTPTGSSDPVSVDLNQRLDDVDADLAELDDIFKPDVKPEEKSDVSESHFPELDKLEAELMALNS